MNDATDLPASRPPRNLPRLSFLFLCSMLFVAQGACAESSDRRVYTSVVDALLRHEAPKSFVVWTERIGPDAMTVPRLPRHNPTNQFMRALAGVSRELQDTLLSPQSANMTGYAANFARPAYPIPFKGMVSTRQIEQIQNNQEALILGFSKIAYSGDGNRALVYSEVCLVENNGPCGGEGFLLAHRGPTWKIIRHAYLWQADVKPFWEFNPLQGDRGDIRGEPDRAQ